MSPRSKQMRDSITGAAGALLGFGFLLMGACTVTPLGATDDGIAKARTAQPGGAEEYEHECSSCHGKRGEGLTTAPAVMGVGGLPTFPRDDTSSSSNTFATQQAQGDATRIPGQSKRGSFRSAQDVFDYVSTRMPLPRSRAGTLKAEEYWAIVNYMLVANGTPVPEGGVTPVNAASVKIR